MSQAPLEEKDRDRDGEVLTLNLLAAACLAAGCLLPCFPQLALSGFRKQPAQTMYIAECKALWKS